MSSSIPQKRCAGCGAEKPLSDFTKSKKGKNGLRSRCRACEAIYAYERYRRPPGTPKKTRKIDLTGRRFERLIVLSENGRTQYGTVLWKCQCDCGAIVSVHGHHLIMGHTKSCGCFNADKLRVLRKGKPAPTRKGYGESSFTRLLGVYKAAAKKRGHSFELSNDEFRDLTQQSCCYCGTPPSKVVNNHGLYGEYIYNGIDRVDSTKGYTIDNVVAACFWCNYAKRDRTHEDFLDWIHRLVEHNK